MFTINAKSNNAEVDYHTTELKLTDAVAQARFASEQGYIGEATITHFDTVIATFRNGVEL